MTQLYDKLRAAIRAEQPVATATLISGAGPIGAKLLLWPAGTIEGSLGDARLDAVARDAAAPLLARGVSRQVELADLGVTLFVESFVPPPSLFMVGGVHIAVALASMARVLGFRTVVVDARAAFASEERFAHVSELVLEWPDVALAGRLDARSCVAVLTHDPKLDDPALRVALRSPACYIGVLGSPATHAKRLARLSAEGFSEQELARIHGPIGLAIGAKTPEEIALSILAQIVAVQRKA
ncbi:MAG: XdhC family protein [Chloroflexi bacterium]|nr:XdhC family protein [Chloroflexota bacterium]